MSDEPRSLNIELQAALNPAGDHKVERFGWTFAPGDKVMQIENDYDKDVHNGDIGYIDDVDPDAARIAEPGSNCGTCGNLSFGKSHARGQTSRRFLAALLLRCLRRGGHDRGRHPVRLATAPGPKPGPGALLH
jgi:ATP-dependent RecD-like DNA helicase SH3 domain